MNIIAHVLIGASVRKYTYRHTGHHLSLTGFLYGNILPDFQSGAEKYPHFYNDSFEFVLDSTLGLCYDAGTEISYTSFEYSKRAGMIMHYITDYFCFAHSQQYGENILHHHLYEFLMIFTFLKGLRAFRGSDANGRRCVPPLYLENFVKAAVRDYNGGGHSKYHDIRCALGVCAPAAAGLIQTSVFLEGNRPVAQGAGLYESIEY